MKFHTRLCSLLLAGTLLLSLVACTSDNTADEPSAPAVTPSTEPSADSAEAFTSILPADFVADTDAEDLCLAITGLPGSFELFTVNGVPVTMYAYLYWLTYAGYELESSLVSYGLPLDWSLDPALSTSLRDTSLTDAARCSIAINKAKELGFEMTQEQVDELDANFALATEYAGGAEAFGEKLRKNALDYDSFYEIQTAPYYSVQLYNGLLSERPTDDELAMYIEENDLLRAKHILLMTVDSTTRQPLDEATIAQKKATAEDILAQLQTSDDLLADFDALMHEYSDDPGLTAYPDGYVFTAGEMVAEFETATRELECGQISGIVESASTGYHIILRLEPNTETVRESCRSLLLTEQLETWVNEADIVTTEEYEALDAALCYEKFIAYQEAFAAEDAASAQSES